MTNPLVSICIPTYRGATFIGASIDSVLRQSYTNFDLWVIDDNSPDDTAEVVARFRDPRLHYLRNDRNLGPEGNWNRCLEVARGKYFKLLPHDDVLAVDCLKQQVDVLERDGTGEVALVFGSRQIVDPAGKTFMTRGLPGASAGRIEGTELARRCVRTGTNLIGEPGNGLIRRSLAERVGPYNASLPYVVDLDYWFRVLLHGDAYYTATCTSSFRVSPGSWSVAISNGQYHDFKNFIFKFRADARFGISSIDCAIGTLKARMNGLGRSIVYWWLFPSRTAGSER